MYRLFLYKTTGITGSALCIDITNKTISKNSFYAWNKNCIEEHMAVFDVHKIKADIEKILSGKECNYYKIHIKETPYKEIGYICIIASYDALQNVISAAYNVAIENELILYDSVRRKTFYYKDLFDKEYVTMRKRIIDINGSIQNYMQPLFRIRKIACYGDEKCRCSDYVVTLKKAKGVSLEKRVEKFYNFLKSIILGNERLLTKNCCFTIIGDFYRISYTLEAYKKRADKIGYISNGQPCVKLMHRMGCEKAVEWMKKNTEKGYDKNERSMRVEEMLSAYPNPADRFVKVINIKKQILQDKITYNYCGYCNGAIVFNVVLPHNDDAEQSISYLSIDEDDVAPIIKVIYDFYPYIYQRYYDNNHLPIEMVCDIVERMKEIRELVVNKTYCEALKPYVENKAWFYSLTYNCDESDKKLYNEKWMDFLYKHRYEAAKIYDIFIEWTEKQIDMYYVTGASVMFNVEGP